MIKTKIDFSPAEPMYPCLKYLGDTEDERFVVLFTEPDTGVVVAASKYRKLGEQDDWDENDFTPFHGTVTLSNA